MHKQGEDVRGRVVFSAALVSLLTLSSAFASGTQPPGSAQRSVSRTSDFNGDGYADLAVGAPFEDVGRSPKVDAGVVQVLLGSSTGLGSGGNQEWSQDAAGVLGTSSVNDKFGFAVAIGDFNGDGFDDLAMGAPYDKDGGTTEAGSVNVLYGSASGLTTTGTQLWTPQLGGQPVQPNEHFGFALAAGDFDCDGWADLAVGAPDYADSGISKAGAVFVLYGSHTGLLSVGSQWWTQNAGGIPGNSESGDDFGKALAAGDFDGNGCADLAIGVPYKDVSGGVNVDDGVVDVLYGTAQSGLSGTGSQQWSQDSDGILGTAQDDAFGFSLAAGDFNGNGIDDLAIGAPDDADNPTGNFAGGVQVLYGSSSGLSTTGNQLWYQSTAGDAGGPEPFDNFGWSLAAGDFNGSGIDDLAIGAPYEDIVIGRVTYNDAGIVEVIYGTSAGLNAHGIQMWRQGGGGLLDSVESEDRFGLSLTAANFGKGSQADLAIGAPSEDVGTVTDAGSVQVVYGSTSGLRASGNQVWNQDSPGILDFAEAGDGFGFALAGRQTTTAGAQDAGVATPDPVGEKSSRLERLMELFRHSADDR
jgi:FG-GAP repeat